MRKHLLTGILAIGLVTTAQSAIYKCVAQGGSTTFSDVPCGAHAQVIGATYAPNRVSGSPQGVTHALTPAMFAAAREQSARESRAIACSTRTFNAWIKAQGRPLPDPKVRIAKLVAISNACRRSLGLSDMIPPAPIPTPPPVEGGAAGAAAAAKLAQLVRSGSIARLQKYLATPGVDVNARPGTDESLLDYAAEQNQAAIAQFLIEHGANVNAVQHEGPNAGYAALHRAAIVDAAAVARVLLANGAVVNIHGPLGVTPLILAASHGSLRTVKVLLEHGADILTADGHGETALSVAKAHDHPDIVKQLLIHLPAPTGSSLSAAAMRGDLEYLRLMVERDRLLHDLSATMKDEALRFAILGGPNPAPVRQQMIELLLADGADANNRVNNAPNTPLMLATSPGVAALLIAHGADVNAVTPVGRPVDALACNASIKDPKAMIELLLAHGASLEPVPPRARSALDCAVAFDRPDFAEFLLDHGMSANLRDGLGRTALFSATDPAMIKLLIAHGANLNAVDRSGLTPLTAALRSHRDSLALSLLAAGADAKGASGTAEAPLSIAARNPDPSVVQALLERGADPNARNRRGESALEEAVEAGAAPVAELLIAHGADLNRRGPMGWTALHYAASRNDGRLVSLLLEHGANPSLLTVDRLPPEALAKSVDMRRLFESHGAMVSIPSPSSGGIDMSACGEVVRRFRQGTLDEIVAGQAPVAPGDPSNDWDYLGQVAQPETVRLQGRAYVLGRGNGNTPVYLARVGADGIESIVCEYEADTAAPSSIRVMTMLERLKARSARDFQSLSLESLKVTGLAGAQALLEASRQPLDPIPLADDSDGNVLGDAIMAHRDDVLAFYLEHGVDPNLPWRPHTLVDGVHSAPWHDAPLYTAVRYGSPESMVMLLDHGANPNSMGGGTGLLHETALSLAVRNGWVARAETLLDHGADPTAASTFYAVTSTLQDISRGSPGAGRLTTVISMLLHHGADPNAWIWVAFQTVAHEKSRNDLLAAALGSWPKIVRSEWIRSLLGSGGNVDPGVSALLEEAAAIRDSPACPTQASSDALAVCLPNALRSADSALNARYQQLAGGPAARRVRVAERTWLRDRDRRCGLRELPSLTEGGWLSYILAEQSRALCVLHATQQRLSELDSTAAG
jgi:ankyrin repeat protein/uncharacterized protein YecT (DUF1311 family)